MEELSWATSIQKELSSRIKMSPYQIREIGCDTTGDTANWSYLFLDAQTTERLGRHTGKECLAHHLGDEEIFPAESTSKRG